MTWHLLGSIFSRFKSPVVLRLDHWSVALARDVTSAFCYYAGRQRGEKVAPHKVKPKPLSKDVLYVEMLWIVQGKV